MCDLCRAWQNKEGCDLSPNFFELICRVHKQPMLVLKEHRANLSSDELEEAEEVRKRHYPDKKFRGYMQSITNHWHDHLV